MGVLAQRRRQASMVLFWLVPALAVLLPAAVEAAEPLRPLRVATPPVIDGRLDDEAWRTAPSVTGFTTWMPDFGVVMKDQTLAYYAYDAENLYFAFRALDSEPSKIKASMASRDSIRPDDWICINLDSFNDQQALYSFYVNPLGIQMDTRFAANREDAGFDTVWYSAGRIDDQGYTIEVRIPFKSIRYRGGNPVTMGVILERFVSRRREDGTYPALDPKAGFNFVIQCTPITFSDIRHYTLLEILPDVTYSRHDVATAGRLAMTTSGPDAGVTAKYGVTAQLAIDGTYNPDFSQVESDAGQIDINLRAPLFFPEKRPFFLEGQDVFNLGGPSRSGTLQAILYTRAIVNPRAGAKLSGKLGRADTIAALYAPDELNGRPGSGSSQYAHFSVMRYKRSLKEDSYLGGFYVGRDQGTAFNRVAGADGSLRLNRSSAVGFYAFGSSTRAEASGPTAAGHAIGGDFTHDTRDLAVYLAAIDISSTFAADAGYLTRSGVTSFIAQTSRKLYPKRGIVRKLALTGGFEPTHDAPSGLWEANAEGAATFTFKGATTLVARCHKTTEVFLGQKFPTSGVMANGSTQLTKQIRLQGSWSLADAIYYAPDPFGGRSTRASASIVYQPSVRWSETLSLTYADFNRASDHLEMYDYTIVRSKTVFQVNRFLFFRGIFEYNSFKRQLLTDLLASFTYIPGTVLHAGYGSLYERTRWDAMGYVPGQRLIETRRGLFLKASYLWRL